MQLKTTSPVSVPQPKDKSLQLWMQANRHKSLRAVLDSDWDVHRVVLPSKKQAEIFTEECGKRQITLAVADSKEIMFEIWDAAPASLLLCVGYNLIFPGEFLAKLPLAINVHTSLLPQYRGRAKIVWGIINGDREFGLTAHLLDPGVDTGPIVMQIKFPLTDFDTTASLVRKLLDNEPVLVLQMLSALGNGGLKAIPQDDKGVQHFPSRSAKHFELNPNRTLKDLYNTIRAGDERYPAHFFVGGQKVCVKIWRPQKPDDESDMV